MSIDPKKFGLSDSLVNAVNEALKGGQKNLDKAPPFGKLTGDDFKKLRGEGSKPDFLDLDKDGNKKEPMKGAAKQANEATKYFSPKDRESAARSAETSRQNAISTAQPKDKAAHTKEAEWLQKLSKKRTISTNNEEVENVDEVSSAMLYRAKQAAQKKASWLMPGDKGKGDKAWNRVKKFRDAGVAKEKQERSIKKEEVEGLDELKKSTVGSYVKKSAQDLKNLEAGRKKGESLPDHIRRNRMQNNRTVGIIRGVNKLTGAAKVPANEEVEGLDELKGNKSGLTKLGYVGKAGKFIRKTDPKDIANDPDTERKFKNRMAGLKNLLKRTQKEEVVDEAQTKQQRAARAALATQGGAYDGGKKSGAINRMALMKPKDLKKLAIAKEEVVDEAAVAGSNVAADMAARKTEIQRRIAAKQASMQLAKSNKRISSSTIREAKCSCGEAKESKMTCEMHGDKKTLKGGKEPILMNPPLKETYSKTKY